MSSETSTDKVRLKPDAGLQPWQFFVLAASIGIRASANEYMRSGNSAMPVPNARMPKPIHTQLTSGLTWISRFATCVPTS